MLLNFFLPHFHRKYVRSLSKILHEPAMIYGHNMKPPEIAVAKNIPKNVVEDKLAVYMQQ